MQFVAPVLHWTYLDHGGNSRGRGRVGSVALKRSSDDKTFGVTRFGPGTINTPPTAIDCERPMNLQRMAEENADATVRRNPF